MPELLPDPGPSPCDDCRIRVGEYRVVYDATYAALAELHGAEFWTADKAFFDTVHKDLKFVRYLPDYVRRVRPTKRKPA
jgi:hypothetical protein